MQSSNQIETGPIARVQHGMHVVDAAGVEVGRVDFIQMGDPEASTTAGNEDVRTGPLDLAAEALGGEREPDVPEPLRSRLVRGGYIKVDGPGLGNTDRYVPGDYVREVSGDRVQLSVRKEDVARED
jgi:hypothetical protein